jgi:hypothetical protein
MKIVEWTDDKGYKHKSKLRDSDPDSMAIQGIPCDPPNLDILDWDGLKRDLHNHLVTLNMVTWDEVAKTNGIMTAINNTFKRPLVNLYKRELRDGGK